MKSTLLFITLFIILSFTSWAQAPNELNYQAVVRNSVGLPEPDNTPVSITFTIHDGSTGGPVAFSETQSLTTNNFGLINTQIGAVNPALDTVNWGSSIKFLDVQIQVNGGALTDIGTTQMVSVPYSLYAASSANVNGTLNYIAQFTANGTTIGNSLIYNNDTAVGIGTNVPIDALDVLTSSSGVNAVQGINTGSNNGTEWGPGYCFAGVQGLAGAGTTQFRAGVYGYDQGEGANSGGVVGSYEPYQWGALGYSDGNGNVWGVYGIGNAYFGGTVDVISALGHGLYATTDSIETWVSLTGFDANFAENGAEPAVAASTGEYINLTSTSYDGVGVLGLAVQTPDQYGAGGVFMGGYFGVYATTKNNSGGYGIYAYADSGNSAVCGYAAGTTQYGVYGYAEAPQYAGYFNGTLYASSTSFPSDVALKENINDYGDALSNIMQLNPKTYTFKHDAATGLVLPSGKQFGFLAQDLEGVFPELVRDNVNRIQNPKNRADRSLDYHFKSVDYISLIPILTKAIQEQEQTIEQLKAEVEQLKNK